MIRVSALSHDYGGVPALCGLDFAVAPGEKIALLGSNGCGKSTLLKLVGGLLSPGAGSVTVRGRDLARLPRDGAFRRDFRRRTGLVLQNPDAMLFNATVRREIAFGPEHFGLPDAAERVERWAAALQVAPLLERAPHALSNGEKQRVCLAAVLALEPDLLLLDEPTASLDPRSTGWLVDFLQDLEATVITSTHNLGLAAELGGRCLLLGEDHTLLADGPTAGLAERQDLLLQANLVHIHRHQHRQGELNHRHYHTHDWD